MTPAATPDELVAPPVEAPTRSRRARRAAETPVPKVAPEAPTPVTKTATEASTPVKAAPDAPAAAAPAAARPVGRRARTAAPVDGESTSTRARKKAPDAPISQPVIAANHVTAVRPHAPKAGRRAADAFSDTIEKPAGGRRARIVTPTSAPAAADDGAIVTMSVEVATVPAQALSAAVETKAPASAGKTATEPPAVVTEPPAVVTESPAVVTESPTTTPAGVAAVEAATPPSRTVSRRTLRSAATVFDAVEPVEPPASPEAPGEASGTPSTAPAKRASGRRVRRGDIAKGTFSIVAMLFATGIAVATTMPASAWHAASDTSPIVLAASVSAPGQELTTSAESAVSAVARDGYAVRDTVAELRAAGMRVADTFTNNPTGAIQWPFPVGVPISDYFGHRESPGGIGSTDHKGVDFTPGQGTTIQSIADGVVSFVQTSDNGGLGVHVIVDHVIDGQKVSSVYGHMLSGSITVSEGQVVKVAQPVGQVGNTGTSTGAHLHLEIRLNGTTPVDPYAWLQTHAV